jgi:pre-mRNA-splicing helicase BRR2
VSEYLSELIEGTIGDLESSRCVAVDDEVALSGLNLGMISAYHYVRYTTMESFASSLTARTKLKSMVEIVAAATEFEDVPVRHREDRLLKKVRAFASSFFHWFAPAAPL